MCITDTLCCTAETMQHCKSTIIKMLLKSHKAKKKKRILKQIVTVHVFSFRKIA